MTPMADVGARRTSIPLLSAAVLAAVLGACATEPRPAHYLPERPSIVEVVEQDHHYVLEPKSEIPAGRIVFRVHNRGARAHDLSLVALPEDLPPILDQLRSGVRRAVVTRARLPSRPPGSSDALAVDLAPGRYALVCFEKDGTGQVHALLGMAVELRVGPPAKAEEPGG